MAFTRPFSRGFTLIELLVVIAVIGVLAAVVMGSLRTARNKAKDATLKVSIQEYWKLVSLDFNETGSYANLQPNVWVPTVTCNAMTLSGNYATKARALCNDMITKASDWYGTNSRIYIGNERSLSANFSIMVALSDGSFICYGSSGQSNTTPATTTYWVGKGCYSNP